MRVETPSISPDRIVAEPEGVCPHCRGRGWTVVNDGGAGTARPCECRKDLLASQYLAHAGIPENYENCTLDHFKTNDDLLFQAVRICEAYINNFYDARNDRITRAGLIFMGTPGCGKTHLAVAVLRELIQRYKVHGRFVVVTSLVQRILSSFDETSEESGHTLLEPLTKAEVLVLDELGSRKPSEWVADILYHIVNTRYTKQLPTIFTTNYTLEDGTTARRDSRWSSGVASDAAVARGEVDRVNRSIYELHERTPAGRFRLLGERISNRLVSRIFEMAQPVPLWGVKDHRTEIMRHRHKLGRP